MQALHSHLFGGINACSEWKRDVNKLLDGWTLFIDLISLGKDIGGRHVNPDRLSACKRLPILGESIASLSVKVAGAGSFTFWNLFNNSLQPQVKESFLPSLQHPIFTYWILPNVLFSRENELQKVPAWWKVNREEAVCATVHPSQLPVVLQSIM